MWSRVGLIRWLQLNSTPRRPSSTYDQHDPPYLASLRPEIEPCPPVNVHIVGLDYALVESYQRVVHRIAKVMGLDVSDCWAVPSKRANVSKYKAASTIVESEFTLTSYQRNVQVLDMPNTLAPLFAELAQAALSQSVSLNIRAHSAEDEAERYVPDFELNQLKTNLQAAGGPVTRRK